MAREAKEFVRQMTIGRQVTLISEYERKMENPPKGVNPVKKFGSIRVANAKGDEENVALLELVKKGDAELVWHGKDESNRSSVYVELQEADSKARDKKIGLNQFTWFDMTRTRRGPTRSGATRRRPSTRCSTSAGCRRARSTRRSCSSSTSSCARGRARASSSSFRREPRQDLHPGNRKGAKNTKNRPDVCIAVRLADIRVGGWGIAQDSLDKMREPSTTSTRTACSSRSASSRRIVLLCCVIVECLIPSARIECLIGVQ